MYLLTVKDGLVTRFYVSLVTDISEQDGFESCTESRLRPETLSFLVEFDHQGQVSTLAGPGKVVKQLHVKSGIFGAILSVIKKSRITNNFWQVGVAG